MALCRNMSYNPPCNSELNIALARACVFVFHVFMRKLKRLTDAYCFKGFTPSLLIQGIFGDPGSLVLRLKRRGKKQSAQLVVERTKAFMTASYAESETYPAATSGFSWTWKSGVFTAAGALW